MILQLGISAVAAILAIQDFKDRSVTLWWLILFGVLCSVHFFYSPISWLEIIYNMIYLTILLSISMLLTQRKFSNGRKSIGSADIIFMYISALLFYVDEFIAWFIISLVTALMIHLLVVLVLKPVEQRIPLLGYMTLTFIPSLFLK